MQHQRHTGIRQLQSSNLSKTFMSLNFYIVQSLYILSYAAFLATVPFAHMQVSSCGCCGASRVVGLLGIVLCNKTNETKLVMTFTCPIWYPLMTICPQYLSCRVRSGRPLPGASWRPHLCLEQCLVHLPCQVEADHPAARLADIDTSILDTKRHERCRDECM